MSLTQVRIRIDGVWINLSYNSATGRYEAPYTATRTSFHEPGGYFDAQVEIRNSAGDTDTANGAVFKGLRLVSQEISPPGLTLVSPPPGYLTTSAPVLTFDAVDESGGSGINPNSFSVSEGQQARAAPQVIPGGYRFTWTPPGGWTDGPHAITASVRDNDGNEATVSAAYLVDTVPPELYITKPYKRHVVDWDSVLIEGEVYDATSPPVSVSVAGKAVEAMGGKFAIRVPLEIGENRISITAADQAGNIARDELYMIRLVTDRTAADVERLKALHNLPVDQWPEADRLWHGSTPCLRGSYDNRDLNRVGVAVRFLTGELQDLGYDLTTSPVTNRTAKYGPRLFEVAAYLRDVKTVSEIQEIEVTSPPATMRFTGIEDWNNIERALVETDAILPLYQAWTAGELSAGED